MALEAKADSRHVNGSPRTPETPQVRQGAHHETIGDGRQARRKKSRTLDGSSQPTTGNNHVTGDMGNNRATGGEENDHAAGPTSRPHTSHDDADTRTVTVASAQPKTSRQRQRERQRAGRSTAPTEEPLTHAEAARQSQRYLPTNPSSPDLMVDVEKETGVAWFYTSSEGRGRVWASEPCYARPRQDTAAGLRSPATILAVAHTTKGQIFVLQAAHDQSSGPQALDITPVMGTPPEEYAMAAKKGTGMHVFVTHHVPQLQRAVAKAVAIWREAQGEMPGPGALATNNLEAWTKMTPRPHIPGGTMVTVNAVGKVCMGDRSFETHWTKNGFRCNPPNQIDLPTLASPAEALEGAEGVTTVGIVSGRGRTTDACVT